jgi:hypothetical protein
METITIITALIGAFATITAAAIGTLATQAKEKANTELQQELGRRASGAKPIKHYLLFWWRGENDWGEADWNAARKYIAKFRPVCGFSRLEAANAELVTIVGATSGVDDGAEKFLRDSGCKVERLDGKHSEDTAELLNRRIRSNQAFEGGHHRHGY